MHAKDEQEVTIAKWEEAQEEHAEAAVKADEAFAEYLVKTRRYLDDAEVAYKLQRTQRAEKWAVRNAERRADDSALLQKLKQLAAAAEARVPASTALAATPDATSANAAQAAPTTSTEMTQGARAASHYGVPNTEAARAREDVVRQLESRKEVYAQHLRCFKEAPLQPDELPTAHLMWNWVKGVEFEDPMLPYTYAMLGVTGEDLTVFLGRQATEIQFSLTNSPHDIVPLQVRQLIGYQLKMLEKKLQEGKESDETFYEEQEKLANAALKKLAWVACAPQSA